MKLGRYFRVDKSAILLLFANILIIIFAVVQKWDIRDVLWIYWAQSLIIGIFNFFHILVLKNFSEEGYDFRLHVKMSMKSRMALFFIIHYGLCHLIFLVFLICVWQIIPHMSAIFFALGIIAFLVTHGFEYWQNRSRDIDRIPNIGDITFYPYARIIPMWLTLTLGIYYGQGSLNTLVLFLVLKTIADVIMHMVDHRNDKPPAGHTGSF